jgi:hypothetical protein
LFKFSYIEFRKAFIKKCSRNSSNSKLYTKNFSSLKNKKKLPYSENFSFIKIKRKKENGKIKLFYKLLLKTKLYQKRRNFLL